MKIAKKLISLASALLIFMSGWAKKRQACYNE